MTIVRRFDFVEKRIEELNRIEAESLRSRAAKKIDEVFRSRTMVPCCPHCRRGILPRDVLSGLGQTDRQMEERRRVVGKND